MKVLVTTGGEWVEVKLVGSLDENARKSLQSLVSNDWPKVRIDFDAITFVNSTGVRDWVHFIREFDREREIVFAACPPELVLTFNLIVASLGTAKVESLGRDYTCVQCNQSQRVLMRVNQDFSPGRILTERRYSCEKCGGHLSPDEASEDYFQFLTAS